MASEPASQAAPADAASTSADAPAATAIATATAPPVLAEGALAYAFVREPVYPADALRRGEQGTVLLRVSVAADGSIERVEIERSSGSSRLDRAARDAVRQWRFRPPLVGGAPAAAVGIVPVMFRLPARA
ncbi:MAG TPA: energy transducer TonB [Dokdonella sp.]|uniref:energy transducer TonB n=1 Tax=Dokdonella sp. TaxID=2291710 RepID=UPI002C82DAEA|nr:energy transducer TonB [Dokdonella sp.]HUD42486.1 energy transducer TonB [Dokdonella sp.]